jgi:hypothetical protein
LLSEVFGPEEVDELFPSDGLTPCCCQPLAQLAGTPGSPRRQRNLPVVDDDREPSECLDARDGPAATGSTPDLRPTSARATAGGEFLEEVKPDVDVGACLDEVLGSRELDCRS